MDKRGKLFEAFCAEFLPLPLSNLAHREVGLPTKRRGGLWVARAFGRQKPWLAFRRNHCLHAVQRRYAPIGIICPTGKCVAGRACSDRTARVLTRPVTSHSAQTKKPGHQTGLFCLNSMAVREGFEPSVRCRTHTFQACSFDHSDTSPALWDQPQRPRTLIEIGS